MLETSLNLKALSKYKSFVYGAFEEMFSCNSGEKHIFKWFVQNSVFCGWEFVGLNADSVTLSFHDKRPEDQRLIYSGKLLLDNQCLRDLLPKVHHLHINFGMFGSSCQVEARC